MTWWAQAGARLWPGDCSPQKQSSGPHSGCIWSPEHPRPQPPAPTNKATYGQHEHGSRGAGQPIGPGKTWASGGTLWTEEQRELGQSAQGWSWAGQHEGSGATVQLETQWTGTDPARRWGTAHSRTQAPRRRHVTVDGKGKAPGART